MGKSRNISQVLNDQGLIEAADLAPGVGTPEQGFNFRNRIINGDMRIDQRNAGAAVTPSSTGPGSGYVVDRYRLAFSQASKLTGQRNAGSVTPPTGFVNYSGITIAATATVGSSDYFLYGQPIEGFNVNDLGWGTANAKTVTLSFWIRSNTTGTFGGAINNSGYNRSYPFSYTISSANTWEYKTVTIAGDTTGTWETTNGVGLYLWFSLGTGATRSTTAGAWAAGEYYGVTGANSLMGSTSNTFYITGVQLEVGSVATPFERIDYGRELIMCQRYCYVLTGTGGYRPFGQGWNHATTLGRTVINLPVTMRASPSGSFSAANTFLWQSAGANFSVTAMTETLSSTSLYLCDATVSGATVGYSGALLDNASTSAKITLAAEL
jgi:hypothetical protein